MDIASAAVISAVHGVKEKCTHLRYIHIMVPNNDHTAMTSYQNETRKHSQLEKGKFETKPLNKWLGTLFDKRSASEQTIKAEDIKQLVIWSKDPKSADQHNVADQLVAELKGFSSESQVHNLPKLGTDKVGSILQICNLIPYRKIPSLAMVSTATHR